MSRETAEAPLTASATWRALAAHHAQIKDVSLRTLFAEDAGRAARFTVEGGGLVLDYSKNRITPETIVLLTQLAEGAWPGGRARRHVPRRQDQRHRESRRAAYGAARAAPTR